jgi:DNA-binding transcriptional MerR regulator
MSDYSTGELARLCGVTVRTVQFYDARGLLHPSDLSEGGRRLYAEGDLRKMRMICALKTMGCRWTPSREFSQASIRKGAADLAGRAGEAHCGKQGALERQKRAVETVRESIRTGAILSIESIADMDRMMEEKKKLNSCILLCCCWLC